MCLERQDRGLSKGREGPGLSHLLWKWSHCANRGDSGLVLLSFHPLLEAVQSCFGPVLGGRRGGALAQLSADWFHASGGGDDLIPSPRRI